MEQAVSHTAARPFVGSYGPAAESMLRARAELAAERGQVIAAATWRELADATAEINAGGPTTEPANCPSSEAHVLATAIRRFSSEFQPSPHRVSLAR